MQKGWATIVSTGTHSAAKTRNLILMGIFAALIAVGAYIRIPLPFSPVPITLQFIFSVYAGLFLGSRRGFCSVMVYILVGLSGIPVFTNGGGIGYVVMPTFGFLLGFAFCALWVGYGRSRMKEYRFLPLFGVILGGLVILYSIGWLYLYWALAIYGGKAVTLGQAFMLGVAPFIVNDMVFSAIAALTAIKVLPTLKKLGYLD